MSFGAYVALARDAAIVGILAWVVWFLYHSGESSVKLADLKSVQTQLVDNAKQLSDWKAQSAAAEVKHDQEVQLLSTSIASQRAPILLCRSPNPGPVPSVPVAPKGPDPAARAADAGPGVDVRAAVNAFELKYERALADCREAIASWPK